MLRGLIAFLIGGVLGAAGGLYIGWVVAPTELTDISPAGLNDAAQQDYLRLVAAAYWEDDNFTAARQQLGALGRLDLNEWLLATTVDTILQGKDELEIRQLVYLASSLGLASPAFDPYLPAKPAVDSPLAPTPAGAEPANGG